jgi:thioredoxin reductase
MNQYDVVVIGGGAAGLSEALVRSRARRTVLVVDAGNPRNAAAADLHGYLSRDGTAPAELPAAGRKEVTSYGGEIADATVSADERTPMLARGIGVVEGTIDQLVIDDADQLRGVQMRDGCVLPVDALFVPPRFVPNSTLLVRLSCDVDTDGWVTVDTTGRTSVPGVWAAGNIADPRAQVITAAGAAAAIAINADLVNEDVRNAVRDLDHGFAVTAIPNTHQESS